MIMKTASLTASLELNAEELEQAIQQRIVELTGAQIQSLDVRIIGNRIVVTGSAACFYHKQLALRGVQEAIGHARDARIELEIEVEYPR
jgi:hypothetical protein